MEKLPYLVSDHKFATVSSAQNTCSMLIGYRCLNLPKVILPNIFLW